MTVLPDEPEEMQIQTKAPHIIAIGELLWDLLPAGARLGGAPANFAVWGARLGNRTALVVERW